MPCYHLLDAWRDHAGGVIFYPPSPNKLNHPELRLPCGQCVGCRLERSRQWALRCVHEASLHDSNLFVTLTYDDEHLPEFNSLYYPDFQKFMKRLRKKFSRENIRFYMCGEYGETTLRPHYHVILFNFDLPDRRLYRRSHSGDHLFTSEILTKIWGKGFCPFGNVTFQSAAYTARYIMKKVTGDLAEDHYCNIDKETGEIISFRRPEFNQMSRASGIGKGWLDKYMSDVYPRDFVIVNGVRCRPPRYYDKIFSDVGCADDVDAVEYNRFLRMMRCVDDNTPDRLLVREEVATAKISSLVRSL